MNKTNWLFRPLFYLVMVLYLFWGYSTLGYGEKWAATLYPEDHYFENIGAISLFVAAGISFYIFSRALKSRGITGMHWIKLSVYLGLAVLYFFGGGEEISWGQRIFNIQETPAMAEVNAQDEFNIHNLEIFEKNELLKADTLFTAFWMVFAVLLPFAALASKRFREFAEKRTPIVYWSMGVLFLINYFGAKLAKMIYVSGYTFQVIKFPQAVQEVKEGNYELLFVFLALFVLWDLNRLIAEKSGSGQDQKPAV